MSSEFDDFLQPHSRVRRFFLVVLLGIVSGLLVTAAVVF